MNVMVGDSFSNETVQFRKVLAASQDQVVLSDPSNTLVLFKIEAVDQVGFFPALINPSPGAVSNGQSLMTTGYNQAVQREPPWDEGEYNGNWRRRYLEGEVYESPLIASEVGDMTFKARQLAMIGTCPGECYRALFSRSLSNVTLRDRSGCLLLGRGRAPVFDSSRFLVGFGKNIRTYSTFRWPRSDLPYLTAVMSSLRFRLSRNKRRRRRRCDRCTSNAF
jgi:hypothetical protein